MNSTIKNIIFDGIILLIASCIFALGSNFFFGLFKDDSLEGSPIISVVNKAASKIKDDTKKIQELHDTATSFTPGEGKQAILDEIGVLENKITQATEELTQAALSENDKKKITNIAKSENKDVDVLLREEGIVKFKESLEFRDNHKATALMMVCYINYTDHSKTLEVGDSKLPFIKKMVENGADINALDKDGWSSLCWAAWSGCATICNYLIDQGANLSILDRQNNSLLMMAAMRGNTEVLEMLLGRGADASLKCKSGLTALDYAKREYERISSPSLIAGLNYVGLKITDKKTRAQNIERFKKTVEILESVKK